MSASQLSDHKINTKEWTTHTLKALRPVACQSEEATAPVSRFHLNGDQGWCVRSLSGIEEVLLSKSLQRSPLPWGDELKLSAERVALLHPQTQRTRALSSAQEVMNRVKLDRFFDRWTRWVLTDLNAYAESGVDDLYELLRTTSVSVVARTLCVSLKGEALLPVLSALEVIDLAGARLLYSGQGGRPAWMPGSEHKRLKQAMHELELIVRTHVRDRIGGLEADDLMGRWVEVEGEDGKYATENEVISESIALLIMAYTALPKTWFGAACELSPEVHAELLPRLQREFRLALEALSAPKGEGAPPSLNRDPARRALPIHNLVALEAERLYPPAWLIPYRLKQGGALGPLELKEKDQVWFSPWALHRAPKRFREPQRFWPQRWAGQLEAQLPRYALAPYGVEGHPRLAEQVCRELLPRFLMVWCERFEVHTSPEELAQLDWTLSLCLRPHIEVSWRLRGSTPAQKTPVPTPAPL